MEALPKQGLFIASGFLVAARLIHYFAMTKLKNHGGLHWIRTLAVTLQFVYYWTLVVSLAYNLASDQIAHWL